MPTTIKAALKRWEEATGKKAGEAKEIKLIGVYPPIEKLEGPFHLLINCEKFSLSTNMISSITNLQAFKCLKTLSLGRNNLKSLQGIEASSETLEQLWISYNQIDRLKPLRSLIRLKVLYMAHNYVREWREFEHLCELPNLEDLVFVGNPLEEEVALSGKYNDEVSKRLLYLKKLDGFPVIRMLVEEDNEDVTSTLDIKEIQQMAGDFDDEDKEEDDDEGGGEDNVPEQDEVHDEDDDGNDEDSDADSGSQGDEDLDHDEESHGEKEDD